MLDEIPDGEVDDYTRLLEAYRNADRKRMRALLAQIERREAPTTSP